MLPLPRTRLIREVTPDPITQNSAAEPRITHCIDWLTYTVPTDMGLEYTFPHHKSLSLTGEVLRNITGYNRRFALTHGSVSFHTERPQQKKCVQFQGRDLRNLRLAGLDITDLLVYALECKATITRLDFAVDYYGPSSPLELNTAWENGLVKTNTKRHWFGYSCEQGKEGLMKAYTMYLGSRKSPKQLRCYDKAAQLEVLGPWTRIELVTKTGYGTRLAQAMVSQGIGCAGKQAIRKYVQCDLAWFNEAVNGPSVYIEPGHRKDTDTRGWLLTQVLPILVRELQEEAAEGRSDIREAFLKALLARNNRPAA